MSASNNSRIKPEFVTDDEGRYTIWPGLQCSHQKCGRDLTSRNRYGLSQFCNDHGIARRKAKAGGKVQKPRGRRALRVDEVAMPSTFRQMSPSFVAALQNWLQWPQLESSDRRLQAALVDHALRKKLLAVLPMADAPASTPLISPIHVEDTHFDNPEHRTTHLEFLSACQHYGV